MSLPDSSQRPDRRRIPADRRLAPTASNRAEILSRHDASLDSGLPTYFDPASGFSVFTADFLAAKGECCDSGCRHCPYID